MIPGELAHNALRFTSQGIAFSLIIPGFLFVSKENLGLKLLENKTIVFIGRLSYSLYLFHWVAMATLDLYHPAKNMVWYLLFLALMLSLSLASFFFVEKPILQLRKRFGSNVK